MRIALVVTGGLHPSGREQTVPILLTRIEHFARGHEVHAFVLRHLAEPASYGLRGATVHDLGRPRGLLAQWHGLRRAMRRAGSFDIIHGYWIDPPGLLAALAGRRLGIPSVVTCASGEFTSLPEIDYGLQRSTRSRAMVSTAVRLASAVHVPSRFMEGLARAHGVDAVLIPEGIDVDGSAFNDRPPDEAPWRLLQVASMNRVKDQLTLLRALAIARQRHDIHLDLVGEDTLDGELPRAASSLGLAEVVTFHGFRPNDTLAAFHRNAHLYVQSSLHEAAGISVLEAAAAGVPIVGTRVGLVSDWAGHAAVAVRPADPEALARAIVDTIENTEQRRSLAQAARRWVREHDAAFTTRAMLELFGRLITKNP